MASLLGRFVAGLIAYTVCYWLVTSHGGPAWAATGFSLIYAWLSMDWWDRESR